MVELPGLITDSSARFEARGFSILPTSSQHWYLTGQSRDHVGFMKRDPGHYKQPSDRMHMFIVLATSDRVANADIQTGKGFLQLLDQFIGRPDPARFKILSRRQHVYREQETDCARFETVTEERNNPKAPGVVFLTSGAGKMCRNPAAPEYFVMASWSERHPIGHESILDAKLREEVSHSIESLVFSAVR